MARIDPSSNGAALLAEMAEFATFPKGTQRYIRRSLDVGLGRRDPIRRWARDPGEAEEIRLQASLYRQLDWIRELIPDGPEVGASEDLLAPLVYLTGHDLASTRLNGFDPYRFLYERLIGPRVRPWLVSVFCGAAALPHLHPDRRRDLLRSVGEASATASGWSLRPSVFFPDWVDKVDRALIA